MIFAMTWAHCSLFGLMTHQAGCNLLCHLKHWPLTQVHRITTFWICWTFALFTGAADGDVQNHRFVPRLTHLKVIRFWRCFEWFSKEEDVDIVWNVSLGALSSSFVLTQCGESREGMRIRANRPKASSGQSARGSEREWRAIKSL